MGRMASAVLVVVAAVTALLPSASAHGMMTVPRSRNFVAHEEGKWWPITDGPFPETCPHCLNLGGTLALCGLVLDRNYDAPKGMNGEPLPFRPQAQYVEGQVIDVHSVLTAHHKGHFELRACTSPTPTQACFDAHPLEFVEDVLYGAKPDIKHPERGYIAPNNGQAGGPSNSAVPDSGGMAFHMKYKLPAGVSGDSVLLQWHYKTANSCNHPDYASYDWLSNLWWSSGLDDCPMPLPHDGNGVPEQFWNCAEVSIAPDDGMGTRAPTPAPTLAASTPLPTLAPTPPPGTPTVAPTDKPTPAANPTLKPTVQPTVLGGSCVSQSLLQCINDASSFWPKCDPSQGKAAAGMTGREYGHYCTQEWTDALNEMLSDPVVNKCGDLDGIRKLLAQVAWETGYYSTVYQPLDGGAGLIHMIPGNWLLNAEHMDDLWPGNNYLGEQASLGKNFFQTAVNGWKSVAAWFMKTNGVISGCGLDLFNETYDTQTRCIFGRTHDRSESYDIVGRCMLSNPPSPTPQASPRPTGSPTLAPPTPACSDAELEEPWRGGGAYTCLKFETLGGPYCDYAEIARKCCFCGGGNFASPVPEPTPVPTLADACSDEPLEGGWGASGTYNCDHYEDDSLAYCAHAEIKEKCCFCKQPKVMSAFTVNEGEAETSLAVNEEVEASGSLPRGAAVAKLMFLASCLLAWQQS